MVSRTATTALILLTFAVMIAPPALAEEDAPQESTTPPCNWLYIDPTVFPPVDVFVECLPIWSP